MSKIKKVQSLTSSQQQKMKEWEEKIKNGEAYKIAKDAIKNGIKADFDPGQGLKKYAETILPKQLYKTGDLTEEEQKELYKIAMCYGLDNNFSMLEAVEVGYRGLIQTLRQELIKEFNCNTYSEKALVDLIINAYSRNLSLSKSLIHTAGMGHTTANLNNYLGIMSKEIDRANRHFITALETLRQFKQPELKVNVKTNTAFISQNQQFNQVSKEVETNENK